MNNLSKNFNLAKILENSDFNLRENWAIFVGVGFIIVGGIGIWYYKRSFEGAEKKNKDEPDDGLTEVKQTYEEALLSPRNSDSTTQGGSDFWKVAGNNLDTANSENVLLLTGPSSERALSSPPLGRNSGENSTLFQNADLEVSTFPRIPSGDVLVPVGEHGLLPQWRGMRAITVPSDSGENSTSSACLGDVFSTSPQFFEKSKGSLKKVVEDVLGSQRKSIDSCSLIRNAGLDFEIGGEEPRVEAATVPQKVVKDATTLRSQSAVEAATTPKRVVEDATTKCSQPAVEAATMSRGGTEVSHDSDQLGNTLERVQFIFNSKKYEDLLHLVSNAEITTEQYYECIGNLIVENDIILLIWDITIWMLKKGEMLAKLFSNSLVEMKPEVTFADYHIPLYGLTITVMFVLLENGMYLVKDYEYVFGSGISDKVKSILKNHLRYCNIILKFFFQGYVSNEQSFKKAVTGYKTLYCSFRAKDFDLYWVNGIFRILMVIITNKSEVIDIAEFQALIDLANSIDKKIRPPLALVEEWKKIIKNRKTWTY
jgi:hypothetical protein